MATARKQERRDNRLSLDPLTELETLQTENDFLRERLKSAEVKLQGALKEAALRQSVIWELRIQIAKLLGEEP